MIQLSLRSRTTSISYSFQPSSDSSINSSLVGDKSRPRSQISSNSSRLYATPPPDPPIVNDGRMIQGKPRSSAAVRASSIVCAIWLRGVSSPIALIALSKRSRSSALSIASASAPINCTPYLSRTPSRSKSRAQFRAV